MKHSLKHFLTAAVVMMPLATACMAQTESPVASGEPQQPDAQAVQRYYDSLNAQLEERSGRKPWQPEVDLRRAAERASPGATVSEPVCGVNLCRFDVFHRDARASERFARSLSDTQATPRGAVFRYHPEEPLRTTTYVLRPPPARPAAFGLQ